MKKYCTLLLIVLFGLVSMAMAQDEPTESYEGAVSFNYPASWKLQELTKNFIRLFQEDNNIIIYGSSYIADFDGDLDTSSSQSLLISFVEQLDMEVDSVFANDDESSQITASADLRLEERDQIGQGIILDTNEGNVILILLTSAESVDEDLQTTLIQIAADIVAEDPETIAFLDAITSATSEEDSGEVETCIIRTDDPSVNVRVGPGANRTSVIYLATNIEFVVEGRLVTDDGDVWYRLNKEEAAPGKSINEAWIAAESVEATGDCEQIGEVAAPPIIAIVSPSTSGGNTGGDTGQTSAPVAVSGAGNGIFITNDGTTPHSWHGQLTTAQATSASSAQLLAMVSENLTEIQNCGDYRRNDGHTIQIRRYRVEYTVRVVLNESGATLGQSLFPGSEPPGCPSGAQVNTTLNGNPPPIEHALGWMLGFLG